MILNLSLVDDARKSVYGKEEITPEFVIELDNAIDAILYKQAFRVELDKNISEDAAARVVAFLFIESGITYTELTGIQSPLPSSIIYEHSYIKNKFVEFQNKMIMGSRKSDHS